MLYEHARYEAARGFSDSELDVLRAIEFDDAQRVIVEDIMTSEQTDEGLQRRQGECLGA